VALTNIGSDTPLGVGSIHQEWHQVGRAPPPAPRPPPPAPLPSRAASGKPLVRRQD